MIQSIADQLRRDEGVRLHPYTDTVGKLTIGIGRNLTDVGLSQDEADLLLENDIKSAESNLEQEFPWVRDLDDVRKGALINMTFNMGIHGLSKFVNFLNFTRNKDFRTASQEMMRSTWAKQVGPRAQRLSIQIESGVWQ